MLFLASRSSIRLQLLKSAGLAATPVHTEFDEDGVRDELSALAPLEQSIHLARLKALGVKTVQPGALILGADQILQHRGEILHKPSSLEGARAQLLRLRGSEHQLHSSAAIVRNGSAIWTATQTVTLAMRDFSDAYLEQYLNSEGTTLVGSVGCYRFEEAGIQLFDRVDGDYFAILGLPLLPLIAFLRSQGELPS